MYSQSIIDRFINPKNSGNIRSADASGTAGNSSDSDVIKIFLKVENEIITEAKFKAFGCVIAIASCDVIIDLILNKTLNEASKISSRNIIEILGEISDEQLSCVSVVIEALHQTLEDYKIRQEKERLKKEKGETSSKTTKKTNSKVKTNKK